MSSREPPDQEFAAAASAIVFPFVVNKAGLELPASTEPKKAYPGL